MPDMPMDQGMEQESPAEDAGEAQGGYCIELYVSPDGQMSISVESGAEEAEEHDGDPTGGGTPVKGLKEAVQVILDIVKNGGQMQDMEGEDQFNAGFTGDKLSSPGKRFG